MAASPSQTEAQLLALPETESQLSSIVYEMSQQVQGAMENMLKMINGFLRQPNFSEIDQSSAEITDDIENCKESAIERKKELDEEKERFQKTAYTVLDMLNNGD